jgi:hypothetical protein
MILVLKDLRQQDLALIMLIELGNGLLLVQLEGDHQVRLQIPQELSRHNDGISAIGTVGRAGSLVGHHFATAGLAGIDPQTFLLALLPLAAGRGIPGHMILRLGIQLGIVLLKDIHFEFRVAVGALHLLRFGIKFDGTVTAGAFELL